MKKEFRYTLSNLKKDWGKKYDIEYSRDHYDNRVWFLEKEILRKILRKGSSQKIMDFACGTGRIAEYLGEIGFRGIVCLDASNEMLKEARKKIKKSKFFCVDITSSQINKKLKKESFGIITAFRFFLNADLELREEAIHKLDWMLKKKGILIFNIHGNTNSLRFLQVIIINFLKYFLQKEKRKDKSYVCYRNQLSIRDIKKLLAPTNIRIKEIYSYSFLPEIFWRILSLRTWLKIERKLITRKYFFGTHLLFVCEKVKK